MPTASSSRRTLSRQRAEPSFDSIEVDEPTQHNVEDVEEDEDEEPRPRRPIVKKAKKKEKMRQTAQERNVDEDVQEDDDPLENFGDQPLDRGQAQKLAGMASDWQTIKRKNLTPYYTVIRDVSTAFAEFADEEQSTEFLEEMETLVRQLLDTETELQAHEQTLIEINQKIARNEAITDIIDRYDKGVDRNLDAYRQRTTRQKYAKSDEYAHFKQAIFEVQNPGVPMPPLTDFIPREDGDESDDDEDVVVGGVTQDYKCPLTLMPIVDPLTSEPCGHSFSAAAIREFLGPHRIAKKKCPASGCNKYICLNDLK
ncbi:hypothetical protein WOLCODRAFT_98254, partial [Wolfiporia cocos MD-104 SS10]